MNEENIDFDTAEVLAEDEGEFRTRKVVRIGDDFYEADENGGERGAWQNRPTKVKSIDRTEARRILLEMGGDLPSILTKTGSR